MSGPQCISSKQVTTNGKIGDLSGERFGKLTAHEAIGRIKGCYAWLCECDCGMFAIVSSILLTGGKRGSCEQYGCIAITDLPTKKATKYLRRHRVTGELVPEDQAFTVKPPKPKKKSDNFGNLRGRMYERYRAIADAAKPGDEVRLSTGQFGFGVAATIIEVQPRHVVVQTKKNGRVRRVPRHMVRFASDVGGSNAITG